jgi:phosphatidate cytidylyltransferase
MNSEAFHRLLDTTGALAHPATRITLIVAGVGVAAALIAALALGRSGTLKPEAAADIRTRTLTWAVIIPLVLGPVIAGALWTILIVSVLSLLCYREFARATGLFRERLVSALVVLGILLVTFANIDHWPALHSGGQAIILSLLCVLSVLLDTPKGYIQRVALGAAAFMLFGVGLGRLGLIAHAPDYRPLLCTVLLCTQLNDIFAYCCGKALGAFIKSADGSPLRLFPNTSPGKTVAGHLGALLLTTPLSAYLFHLVFKGSTLDTPVHLICLGLIISIGGQLGDLTMSSVKRDVGIKDMGVLLPGHGGVLDRCNSLLFVAPGIYHYIEFFRGIAHDTPMRIFTGA